MLRSLQRYIMTDAFEVLAIFQRVPDASTREIAFALGWFYGKDVAYGRRRRDTARVHRALTDLAADKKVMKVGKRWVLVKRS